MYGIPSSMDLLLPFGSVGYMFIPKEKRNKPGNLGKQGYHAERVRFLMCGDDNDTEEILGWKILVESDRSIHYSKYVKWNLQLPRTPIPGVEPDNLDIFLEDDDSDSDYEDNNDSLPVLETESEHEFAALSTAEISGMTNTVHDLYKDWFDSDKSCGIDPETIMFALLAMTDGVEVPQTYEQAISGPEAKEWMAAMDSEYQKIQNLETYKLEKIDQKTNIVKCKWVFKKKLDVKGNVLELKARLCAKGFTQRYGIDFLETFAPVAKIKSMRALTQIYATNGLKMFQDDVPSAFLNPHINERVVMSQIPGYDDGSGRFCVLQKTLYGLKQSPREWNLVMNDFLESEGFKSTTADSCIYVKRINNEMLLVAVYVDDIITCGKDSSLLNLFRKTMHSRFNMKPGSILSLYLNCYFQFHDNGNITMTQTHYLNRKLTEFEKYTGKQCMSKPLPANYQELLDDSSNNDIISPKSFPYREMVGSLMYAMVSTRPDLAQPLSIVSRYLSKPNSHHCNLVRHLYQYVRGNLNYELTFRPSTSLTLIGYADAAYGNNFECKSTTGYCFTLGGTIVSWYSKAQPVTAQSAAEAEYISACEATKEAIWWRCLLQELGYTQLTTIIHEDNQACILLSKNPQAHSKTKHIQIKYHFIREKCASKEVRLQYLNTKDMLADMFTKNLPGHVLRPHLQCLGITYQKVQR